MKLWPAKLAYENCRRKVITTATVKALGTCSFERAKHVFLSGIDPETNKKEYERLLRRLEQIWLRVQRMS